MKVPFKQPPFTWESTSLKGDGDSLEFANWKEQPERTEGNVDERRRGPVFGTRSMNNDHDHVSRELDTYLSTLQSRLISVKWTAMNSSYSRFLFPTRCKNDLPSFRELSNLSLNLIKFAL